MMSVPEEIRVTLTELNELVSKLSQQVTDNVTLHAGDQYSEGDAKEVKIQVRKVELELSKILPEIRTLSRPSNGSASREDALKRRAERFGVVSDELKKLSDKEKLLKRKERFSSSSAESAAGPVSSESLVTSNDSVTADEAKKKRLQRFSLPAN
jgi:hypothetical protein